MKISKASLRAVELCAKDIPMLDNICILPDGTVVSSNGKAVLAVEPVSEEICESVPVTDGELKEPLVISSTSIKEIIKNIPADKMFKGLLEFCSFHYNVKREQFFSLMTDGFREQKIEVNIFTRGFIKFKTWFEEISIFKSKQRIVINRKKLISLLTTMDKICPDRTESSYVYIDFTDKDGMILKTMNHKTGQRCIAIMNSYSGDEGIWLKPNKWEFRLCTKRVVKKKK